MIENSEEDKKDEIIKRILNSYLVKRKEGYTKHVLNYIENLGHNTRNYILKSQSNVNNKNIGNKNNINNDKDEI